MIREVRMTAVVGGRPNVMKMAAIMRAAAAHNAQGRSPRFNIRLVHAGAANDSRLSDTAWEDVRIAEPAAHLGVGAGSGIEQTARIMLAFEKECAHEAEGVIVVGDGEASFACAFVAAKKGLPVFHVEAGLRSGNMAATEEINRILTDKIAVRRFAPGTGAAENLLREGADKKSVVCVGNVMIDTLLHNMARSAESTVLERLGLVAGAGVALATRYAVLSLRRPENLSAAGLGSILQSLSGVARLAPMVVPLSAISRKGFDSSSLDEFVTDLTARLESTGTDAPALPAGIYTVPPIAYLDFLRLLSRASLVITDSGGIQEETTVIGIPCLTLRDETERPVTVTEGTNTLVGKDRERLRREAIAALSGNGKRGRAPSLWDGHAAERVITALAAYYQERR